MQSTGKHWLARFTSEITEVLEEQPNGFRSAAIYRTLIHGSLQVRRKKIGASIFDEPVVNEPATEVEDDSSEFSKGVSAGIDQTMGLGGALKAAAGSVIGNDEWVEEGMDYYRQMQEAEQVGAKTNQVEDIENLGDFFNYAGYTLVRSYLTLWVVA